MQTAFDQHLHQPPADLQRKFDEPTPSPSVNFGELFPPFKPLEQPNSPHQSESKQTESPLFAAQNLATILINKHRLSNTHNKEKRRQHREQR